MNKKKLSERDIFNQCDSDELLQEYQEITRRLKSAQNDLKREILAALEGG